MTSRRRTVLLPHVGGGRPPRRLLVVLALVLSVTAVTAYFSGATYVSGTQSQVTVNAAPDLTPPTVSVSVPASVSGTATIAVTAADVSGVVTRVVVQRQRSGGAWTELCVRTAAPWGCAWDTTAEPDGDVQLRAVATDSALLSATSATVTTRVANAGAVALNPVPDAVKGTVNLAATVSGAAGRTMTSNFAVRFDGGTWTTICTGRTGATPTCSWNAGTTTRFADVRVQTVFGTGTSAVTAEHQIRVLVDGTSPTVSLILPGTLSAAVTVAPTVADAHSGVASVRIEYRRLGLFGIPATGWQEVCTTTSAPWSCVLDTSVLNGGANYEIRATATDRAGNAAAESATARVSIFAALAITSPSDSDTVRGVLEPTIAANAGLLGSVSYVRLNYRRAGTSAWTEICTDTTAPYSCTWDTRDLPNGGYELRAETPPAVGTTSDVITVNVDNPPVAALDVQGTNGGTAGVLDAGDTYDFTLSARVDLTSVRVGWSGAAVQLTGTLRSSRLAGGAVPGTDWLTIPGVGELAFGQHVINPNATVGAVPLTLRALTGTVGGVPVTILRVTIGALSDNQLRTATESGTLRWAPASTLRDTAGRPIAPGVAVESGPADGDL